ncbi:MAG TPA: NUDIX hydrolase [Nocardioides sp.]|uniref:NUDIX hydrolase n=1 Tax=Nocardioides sp. TaxID=35761 RepID=UPI002E320601|nr:NUDIX hydrolase [Nocardioides sp.]HEX3931570.1 NUDIX hydrolase [Nocardioides sp.]
MTKRVAGVVLVDPRGWLLLQERDEHAPVNPDEWSFVGGGVEAGESDEEAAVRELAEETEVTGVDLTHADTFEYFCDDCGEDHVLALYLALTRLTDSDVVCHEGRQIVFVDPRTIDTLRWGRNLVHGLPRVMRHPVYVERFGLPERREFGCVLLVDARGRVLLQERDEHAPIDPDRWGLSGGHLEPGEDGESGAYRELEEETGVRLPPGTLERFATLEVFHPHYGSVDRVHVYVARVDLADEDVECHEGRQIVFVEPDRARRLDLTMTGVLAVPAFLDSEAYRRLRGR